MVLYFALDETFQNWVLSVPSATKGWNPVQEWPYRTLWKSIEQILIRGGKRGPLSKEALLAQLCTDPEDAEAFRNNFTWRDEVVLLLDVMTGFDRTLLPASRELVRKVLQKFTDYRVALPETQDQEGEDLKVTAEILLREVVANRPATINAANFMNPAAPLPDGRLDRVPFGIDWLDELTEGGMACGDAMLFVAPSGGGKTTFGIQLAHACAKQGRHAAYCSYEQEVDTGDILTRFLAMATGMPRKEFEGKALAEMPPNVQHAFQKAREWYGIFLHPYDMSRSDQGNHGVSDYEEIIRTEDAAGRRPTLIIVDWLETAVRRSMTARNTPEDRLTAEMERFAQQFALMCRDNKVQGVLLQQMQAASQAKRQIEAHHSLAARCRSLANYCRFALGLARLSEEGIGRMQLTKATTSSLENKERLVRLNGPMNRFEAAHGIGFDKASNRYCRTSEEKPKKVFDYSAVP
jgi:RecA/RadA recombinase